MAPRRVLGGKACGDHQDAAYPSKDEVVLEFPPVASGGNGKVARCLEAGGEIARERGRFLDHQGDTRARRIERHAITEEEEEDQWQDEGDQDTARIAYDLIAFLAHQGSETPGPARRFVRFRQFALGLHAASFASEP